MKTIAKKLYEAMFLVDSALAGSDWDGVIATIKNMLQRAEAEIVSLRKWADRRLAYEIDHKSKGTYILCYFRADGSRIRDIERNVRLSERIMRVLILSTENHTIEDIEREPILQKDSKMGTQKDTPTMQTEKRKAEVTKKAEEKQVAVDQEAEQATDDDSES